MAILDMSVLSHLRDQLFAPVNLESRYSTLRNQSQLLAAIWKI